MKILPLRHSILPLLAGAALLLIEPARAITLGQVDDFQDGTTMNWRGNATFNAPDEGPLGAGDHALRIDSFQRMLARNDVNVDTPFPNPPAQWAGDYTAAGVSSIAMDVKNPNDFALQLYLGISNEDLILFTNGMGPTYVSASSITVPADNQWHHIVFPATADAFVPSITNDESPQVGSAAILQEVYQLRVLHTTTPGEFRGDPVQGHFFLDNIRAIPEPSSGALVLGAIVAAGYWRRSRR
jgi:hypothetical protein